MSDEEKIKEQYLTSDNLERRISIYDYGMADECWANWVFRQMNMKRNVLVDEAKAIYDYVNSYPGNAAFVLEERGKEFTNLLENKIKEEGAIYIHGSTGIFICMKN